MNAGVTPARAAPRIERPPSIELVVELLIEGRKGDAKIPAGFDHVTRFSSVLQYSPSSTNLPFGLIYLYGPLLATKDSVRLSKKTVHNLQTTYMTCSTGSLRDTLSIGIETYFPVAC